MPQLRAVDLTAQRGAFSERNRSVAHKESRVTVSTMLLAINPATFAFLPVALAGAYLLYKLWAPSQEGDSGLPIDVKEGQPDSRSSGALSTYETFLPETFVPAGSAQQASFNPQIHAELEAYARETTAPTPLYPVEHLPGSVLMPTAPLVPSLEKEATSTYSDRVFPDEEATEADFTLDGLFNQDGSETKDARETESQPVQNDQPEKKERRAAKRGGLRNTVAQFPFDVRAWENPGSPKSVVRAQRRAEKAEKAQRIHETRVTVQDAASKGESLVLAQPAELPKEMFADVWELASGQTAPDALETEGIDEKTARRAAKRAEREERKLNKLQSKQEKKEAQRSAKRAPDDSFYVETDDPWAASDSAGQGAYIDSGTEVGAPVEWVPSEEEPSVTTWVVGGEGPGMGDKATTWEAAAASVGPLVPSATMITGEELLEMGSSIVIGTEPGAGDGAFYLPEGFEAIEVEAESHRKRRLGRKRREEEEEPVELESVNDWAQGGVVLDPDEGVNYQDYDIPEPIPSRTVIIFGESEES